MTSAAILLAGVIAMPAWAQADRRGAPSTDLAVQAVHSFAACVADTTPRGAAEVLAMDYRTPAYAKGINRLARGHGDHCILNGRMGFSQVLFAGGMAERLVTEHADARRFPAMAAANDGAPSPGEDSDSLAMALCIVRAEPAKTLGLFATEPMTPPETEAMKALDRALIGCAPKGRTLRTNIQGLRAILAIAAYRIAGLTPATAG